MTPSGSIGHTFVTPQRPHGHGETRNLAALGQFKSPTNQIGSNSEEVGIEPLDFNLTNYSDGWCKKNMMWS